MSSKLPAALAARLAKRGLIPKVSTVSSVEPEKPDKQEEEEEVIAEDYDDTTTGKPEIIELKPIDTVRGCPNKYNIYHNCTIYCSKKFASNADERPSKKIRRQFERLLKKFPLEDSVWEQVWEPGLKTYYFWNTETDQVSWLPPSHPDAKISMPAEKLRRLVRDDHDDEDDDDDISGDDDNEKDSDSNKSHTDDDDDDGSSESDSDDSNSSQERNSIDIRNRFGPSNSKRPKLGNNSDSRRQRPLDPMDPASYSAIPRGKWSDGL